MGKTVAESNILIVGLGLMGGSLAQALRPHVRRLLGVDSHAGTRQRALQEGVVNHSFAHLGDGLAEADLVVLATPVRSILEMIPLLPALKPEGCLVLDLGSTKQAICESMGELPASFAAIGGHPMCGRELAGYEAATPDLYHKQTFVLSPTERTTPTVREVAGTLVDMIGAYPLEMPADRHDTVVATTSHLPYLLSAALMQQAGRFAGNDETVWRVSASGFRDTTRIAGTDPQVMLDILLTNRTAVLDHLSRLRGELDILATALARGDEDYLRAWLTTSQRQHQRYRRIKAGL